MSFRPQQGLTIMNLDLCIKLVVEDVKGFRPQQGLTIMNKLFGLCGPRGGTVSVPNRG